MNQKASPSKSQKRKPFAVVKVGNVSLPIYRHANIIPKRDAQKKIIYGPPNANGKRRALVKYKSEVYTLAYYEGSKRVLQQRNLVPSDCCVECRVNLGTPFVVITA